MPIVSHITHLTDIVARHGPVLKVPLSGSSGSFTLDFSGVAGFFGGDSAVFAMSTVHLLPKRFLGGWYNSPGSYEIAKQYGQLANSRLWDGLFPGPKCEPAELFGLDGKAGPTFFGAHSGTRFERTGHLAYLIARKVAGLTTVEDLTTKARVSKVVYVTVVDLRNISIPPFDISPSAQLSNPPDTPRSNSIPSTRSEPIAPSTNPTASTSAAPSSREGSSSSRVATESKPPQTSMPLCSKDRYSVILSLIPILSSLVTCILCGLAGDWWCFSNILLGIVANGLACLTIGSGKLTFSHPQATRNVPSGDGILRTDDEVVILLGDEDAVNVFTRGCFSLRFPPIVEAGFKFGSTGKFAAIGLCSGLLTVQFLAQLLLIPQGTLFGQLMFITSLAVSWMYNMYLSSIDGEEVQTDILFRLLPELLEDAARIQRFKLPSWTAMTVFAMVRLQENVGMRNPRGLLDELIPNDTPVWRAWKKKVMAEFPPPNGQISSPVKTMTNSDMDEDLLDVNEGNILETWMEDARKVYAKCNKHS